VRQFRGASWGQGTTAGQEKTRRAPGARREERVPENFQGDRGGGGDRGQRRRAGFPSHHLRFFVRGRWPWVFPAKAEVSSNLRRGLSHSSGPRAPVFSRQPAIGHGRWPVLQRLYSPTGQPRSFRKVWPSDWVGGSPPPRIWAERGGRGSTKVKRPWGLRSAGW